MEERIIKRLDQLGIRKEWKLYTQLQRYWRLQNGFDKKRKLHDLLKCLPRQATKAEEAFVLQMISERPQSATLESTDSKDKGQTPLHIAICRGHIPIVQRMLEESKERKWHEICATGTIFDKSAMSGQLPLTVAALTLNPGLWF